MELSENRRPPFPMKYDGIIPIYFCHLIGIRGIHHVQTPHVCGMFGHGLGEHRQYGNKEKRKMLGSFDDFLLVISSFVGIKPRKQLVACFHFLILIHYIYIYIEPNQTKYIRRR